GSPATLNVHPRTLGTAGSLAPRLARNATPDPGSDWPTPARSPCERRSYSDTSTLVATFLPSRSSYDAFTDAPSFNASIETPSATQSLEPSSRTKARSP